MPCSWGRGRGRAPSRCCCSPVGSRSPWSCWSWRPASPSSYAAGQRSPGWGPVAALAAVAGVGALHQTLVATSPVTELAAEGAVVRCGSRSPPTRGWWPGSSARCWWCGPGRPGWSGAVGRGRSPCRWWSWPTTTGRPPRWERHSTPPPGWRPRTTTRPPSCGRSGSRRWCASPASGGTPPQPYGVPSAPRSPTGASMPASWSRRWSSATTAVSIPRWPTTSAPPG